MSAPDRNIDQWIAQARQARTQLQPDWRPERQERALRGVYKARRREQVLRAAGGATALLAVALFAVPTLRAPQGPGELATGPQATTIAAAPAQVTAAALRLDSGAVVEALGAAQIEPAGLPGAPALRLRGGAARFRAAPGAPVAARTFRVEVAGASVEILGTVFLVEELAGGARVRAEGEAARVTFAGQLTDLAPGEARTFPRHRAEAPGGPSPLEAATATAEPAERPAPAAGSVEGPAPATAAPAEKLAAAAEPAARPAHRRSWRTLAQDGQFERAYGALKGDDSASEIDEPGDLLLLADVARLSRHPREAVAPLERLLGRHRRDPRAPLAAFTLGRVLLDDLGRPREAAAAFLRALQLDPQGPMAQDALAREVEAWSRAGDGGRARERAEAYLRLYPEGRRLRSVRRFGGLD